MSALFFCAVSGLKPPCLHLWLCWIKNLPWKEIQGRFENLSLLHIAGIGSAPLHNGEALWSGAEPMPAI